MDDADSDFDKDYGDQDTIDIDAAPVQVIFPCAWCLIIDW